MKRNKGISLIVLVITIIVMIILASAVVVSLNNTDLITKAGEAVDGYNEQQNDVLSMLEWADQYLEGYEFEDGKRTVIYEGSITGSNGELTLPVTLNDASNVYILNIQSSKYNGEVLINSYNILGNCIALTGLDTTNSYPLEVLPLIMMIEDMVTEETSATSSTIMATTDKLTTLKSRFNDMFGKADLKLLAYENGKLKYDLTDLGGDIKVTKISKVTREYTNFAKLVMNARQRRKFLLSDYEQCIRYCLNNGALGYSYINEFVVNENASGLPTLNEALERQTLQNILNNRMDDVEMLEQCISDQLKVIIYTFVRNMATVTTDFYTLLDFLEENESANKMMIRYVGNTVIPFTLLYADVIMQDLNEDGVLGGTTNCAVEDFAMILPSNHAGVSMRTLADLYAEIYPMLSKHDYNLSNATTAEQMTVMARMACLIGDAGNNATLGPVLTWTIAYQLYETKNMDTLYTKIHETGANINLAGLRMGWNSIISPVLAEELGDTYSYDLRNDTKALNAQQASGIANDLYAYVQSALNPAE